MGFLLFFHLVFVPFSFSPDFFSKISPQPFKMEISNLVYRFKTTSCNVEVKMEMLLFVLPCVCSFSFFSRFFIEDIVTTVLDRNFKFGIQVYNDKLYSGIENGSFTICSSLFFSFFFFFFCSYLYLLIFFLFRHPVLYFFCDRPVQSRRLIFRI